MGCSHVPDMCDAVDCNLEFGNIRCSFTKYDGVDLRTCIPSGGCEAEAGRLARITADTPASSPNDPTPWLPPGVEEHAIYDRQAINLRQLRAPATE